MEMTEPSSTITPSTTSRARADEAVIFDDGRVRLQRLQYATDADTAGQMHVFTDLCAGADGGPGINHGAFVNVGADVNVGRHQHSVAGDERAPGAQAAGGTTRKPSFWKTRFVVVSEFHRHFIEVAVFRTIDNLVIVNTEREQYRLLQPLMRYPLTVDLLSDAQRAGIRQKGDNLVNPLRGSRYPH